LPLKSLRWSSIAALLLLLLTAKIHAASAPPVSLYGNLPGLEMAAISPTGSYIALVGVVEGRRRVIVLDKDQRVIQAVPLDDQKVRWIDWAGDGKLLIKLSSTVALGQEFTSSKAELSSVIVMPVPGGTPFAVFERSQTITGGVFGYFGTVEKDGHRYGYFGGLDTKNGVPSGKIRPDLYQVDLDTGKARSIAQRSTQDTDREWLVDAHGDVAASLDFSPLKGNWLIRNGKGATIASGRARQGGIGLLSLGRAPDTLIYSESDEVTGVDRWMEVSLKGGAPVEILSGENISAPYFDGRTRLLIGHAREGDVPEAYFYDAARQKAVERVGRAFPGRQVQLVDWNDDFDRLIIRTDGSGDPQTWWIVDIKGRSAKELGTAYPLAESAVGLVRMVRYKASDGLDLNAVLSLPPGRKPTNLPVIVLPHGGPTARDYPIFDWWAQAFASRGYAVVQPNFRGSSGYGAEFRMAGNGEWGRKMQTDMSDGLAELARQGIVDPKRACIMGASYGGYAALAGVTLQHGLYRCAVSVSGISDVSRFYQTEMSESGNDRTLMRSLKAEIGSGRDLQDISPIRYAAAADAPILLVHGKDDTVVLYQQSTSMADALRRAKKPVELVTLPAEDHWMSRSVTRRTMLQAALDFVQKYNPADPGP